MDGHRCTEGKTTQPTKRRAPIMDSKMDFSWQNWEQKWSVFLQCTQSLVLTQEEILAVGTDVHRCTRLKGKTKRRAPIVHSKMDFSRRIWEQERSVFLQCTQSLVLTQEATIAIGTDGHCCTRLYGKRHSKKNAPLQSCIQKWTFLCDFGSKNNRSFCNEHNVMIQETLHIPGGEEKAFLVLQESWWEVPWWKMSCLQHFLRVSYWYQFGENALFPKLVPVWNA